MELGHLNGQTEVCMQEQCKITNSMVKVLLSGQKSVNTSASGCEAECMAKELYHGRMGVSSEACSKKTRSKDLESSNGPMAGSSWGTGKMGSKMDLGFLLQLQGQGMKEGGNKGSCSFGYKQLICLNLNQTFLQNNQK